MATIHPYKGYLNTEFHFYANGTEDISYDIISINVDTEHTIKSGILSPNIPHSIKLNEAGSFRVDFNDGTSTKIIVEDGYKFGGSKHKKSFIFDETPWCFIIMNDRTYFYNRETEEGYVESISPDEIEVISEDYIIFSNSNHEERTIYSLDDQKPILNVSNIIYHNEEVIIWNENEEIILFSLKKNAYIARICPIQYLIDKENNQLLYANSQTIFALNLFDDYQTNELYHWVGVFHAFVNNNITVYSSYKNRNRYLQVVNHTTKELVKEISIEGSISSINGHETINLYERRQAIRNFDINKSEFPEATISACYHDFIFYPCDWDIYYLERKNTFTKHSSHFDAKEECSLHSLNTDLNQTFKYLNNKIRITDNRFLIFNGNESFVRSKYYDAAGYINGGHIHIHKDTIIIEKDKCVYTLSRNGYWYNKIECEYNFTKFETYGIVKDNETGIYKSFSYNIKGEKCIGDSNPVNHIELGNSIILEGGKVYYKKYDLHKFSVKPLAVSPNMTQGITIEDNNLYLLDISSEEEVRKQILLDIFDASEYRDVILGEDGCQILYRDSKVTRVTDIISGETFDFGIMSYVQHTNGIRSHFSHRAGSLQPRLVNPVTGQILDSEIMTQYNFISPNGRFYADAQLDQYVEYYWHSTNELLSKDEYLNICKMYTYPWQLDKNSEESRKINSLRKKLVIENFLILNKKYPNVFKNDKTGEKWEEYVLDNKNKFGISRFIDLFIGKRGIAVIRCTSDRSIFAKINLGDPLWFINYVSFSYDNRYVALAGRYPNGSGKGGLFLVYDLVQREEVSKTTNSWAVWLTSFNKNGRVAAYSSEPITYNALLQDNKSVNILEVDGYNFLTFSPDGNLTALSKQVYISQIQKDGTKREYWGHQPSCNVYITSTSSMDNIIQKFSDLSHEGIEGISDRKHNFSKTVASVSFSNDNKRIMMVGNDGVVIIRNLHLEKYANK